MIRHTILLVFSFMALGSFAQSPKAKDLGLSVRWADRNVGASSPEEYGEYFAWGETETKRFYGDQSKYKYIDSKKYRKYNYVHFIGKHTVDSLFTLQKVDDVATQRYGSNWRMPTAEEIEELFAKCTFIKGELKGAKGFFVTNADTTSVADTIFIPLVGQKSFGNFRLYPATTGYYWTSSLMKQDEIAKIDSIDPEGRMVWNAKCMILADRQNPSLISLKRNIGCAIRAVYTKSKKK